VWADYKDQISDRAYNDWVRIFNAIADIKFASGRIPDKPDAGKALNRALLRGLYNEDSR